MKQFFKLVKRNVKIFYKDKGLFFTSLITPLILLVLYGTFLGNIFKESYTSAIPEEIAVDSSILAGLVNGQLFASIIAVSCVTVAFCSNMLMVQDKINGAKNDFLTTPVSSQKLALSYFTATFINTFLVCMFASLICFIYSAFTGWFFSFGNIVSIVFDVLLLTLFGTLLASIVNSFLSSQGQISAVGSIVSSVYGFICGAYMPIASFSDGLASALMFLPSTYTTSLIKNHTMQGALEKLTDTGVPNQVIESIQQYNDLTLNFFGSDVSITAMYLIIGGTIMALLGIYLFIHFRKKSNKKQNNKIENTPQVN